MSHAVAETRSVKNTRSRPLDARVTEVAQQLSEAGERFFSAFPHPVRAPVDLTSTLGLGRDVASRLLSAFSKRDPLAMLCAMPGPEALYKIGQSARDLVTDPEAVDEWCRAAENFKAFLVQEIGGKHALDALASAWLPEARAKFEMANRQGAYKCMGNLRGMTAEVGINTCFFFPNSDGETVDRVFLTGFVGLRRLRPGLPINVGLGRRQSDPAQTLKGLSATAAAPAMLLEEFCSKPLPSITITESGAYTMCKLEGDEVGKLAVCNLFMADFAPSLLARWAEQPGSLVGPTMRLDVPSERLVFDVLVHDDLWTTKEPELRLYELGVRGGAKINDPTFEPYRMDFLDTVRALGKGIHCCRVAEVVAYQDILRHVCDARRWDPNSFRCYRCDSQYPVYGVQYTMAFEAPERPRRP